LIACWPHSELHLHAVVIGNAANLTNKYPNMKYVTVAASVTLLVGVIIGIAYGTEIPVIHSLAQKLPGATAPAAAA
jgi:hypothetical protein